MHDIEMGKERRERSSQCDRFGLRTEIHKATSINGAKDFAGGFGRCGDSSPYDDTDETCAGD